MPESPPPAPPPPPLTALLSPLGEAAEGFVGLARWFTTLVGDEAVRVARAVDGGTFDADVAAGALARAATAPLLGWAALVNEVFDSASVLTSPFARERTITSGFFDADRGHVRELALAGPLVNGFDGVLPVPVTLLGSRSGPDVTGPSPDPGRTPAPAGSLVLPPDEGQFRLRAVDVPPAAVGVYRGKVTVTLVAATGERTASSPIDVWLVIP